MIRSALTFAVICECFLIQLAQAQNADRYIDAYKAYLDASCPVEKDNIKHYAYFIRDRELIRDHPFLNVERFEGAQIMYSWRQNFSQRKNTKYTRPKLKLGLFPVARPTQRKPRRPKSFYSVF